ncbi:hypothetical protein Tco_0708887, partial [Tanacetum coccineum]
GRLNVLICSGLELIKDDLKWNVKAAKDEIIVNTGKSQEERELVRIKIDDGNAFWNEIEVNAGDSKLMLLGINLKLLLKVDAVRVKLTTAVES